MTPARLLPRRTLGLVWGLAAELCMPDVAALRRGASAAAAPARDMAPTPADIPTYTLSDGYKIPAIGLGVYRIPKGEETYNAVRAALDVGYRMIDTAHVYGNEADVGRACRDSGIPRSELFVTTKVFDHDHGFKEAMDAGRRSSATLGLGYIDLLLMHSPGQFSRRGGKIVETYDGLLQLQKEGVTRSVGVSNFGERHLQALSSRGRPTPVVNQFELHPLVAGKRASLIEYCRARGILVQPYGSVLSGHAGLMERTARAASGHGKTAAQVLLRWAVDQGFQVIPKSVHRDRQVENLDVFDFHLSEEEIRSLSSVKGELSEYWDPIDNVPVDIGDLHAKDRYSGKWERVD